VEVHINRAHGLRNDLLIVIPRAEIEDMLFNIANRNKLMRLPGLLRHRPEQDSDEKRQVNECKISVEDHLKQLLSGRNPLLDASGNPKRPIIVIGNRNVGNNHGFIAWQRDEGPKLFHVQGEPFTYSSYSCLVKYRNGELAIRPLRFMGDQVLDGDKDITEDVAWCSYANRVLRDGKIVDLEEIIDQFYDIRHVLAFNRDRPEGRQIEDEIYESYPERFRENVLRVWREGGVSRNRFLHNCLGLSDENVILLQREGTIEEIAYWLKEAGARDGIILDNGGSPFCWVWWLYPKGGFLFTAPDFRPNSSAVIALILKGPVATQLPSGSAGFNVL
jgi:hypothetical protein